MSGRGLTLEEAAAHCGVETSTFYLWRQKGLVPGPWPGTKRWDRKALDLALDRLSNIEHHEPSAYERSKARDAGKIEERKAS